MKYLWTVAASVSLLALNYQPQIGFYCSMLAFLAIAFFLRLAFKKDWAGRAGLVIPFREIIIGIAGTILLTAAVYYCITVITEAPGITFRNRFELGNPQLYLFTLFQTLNEEIIAGALLLFSLRKNWPRMNPLIISTAAALVFSGAHYLIYSFVFAEHSIIHIPALISLFAAGIIRNNAILVFGHIGFSWMIHLSWNLVFFGGRYLCGRGLKECTQADLFNTVMGDMTFVTVITLFAGITSLVLILSAQKRKDAAS